MHVIPLNREIFLYLIYALFDLKLYFISLYLYMSFKFITLQCIISQILNLNVKYYGTN